MGTLGFVALGGALGAAARYGLGLWLAGPGFPVPIIAANVLGSFLMGLAVVWTGRHAPGLGPFLMTGVLGGFTTFSAFSLETVTLIERGMVGQAILYVALSVCGALLALALGVAVARGGLA
ncbi:MAG: fluoride efflux transporter FluC [Shimia sp.]